MIHSTSGRPYRPGRDPAALCLALLAITAAVSLASRPQAAPPSSRPAPRRFLDSLIGRPQPEPAFIQAPTPPGPNEIQALERMAAARQAAESAKKTPPPATGNQPASRAGQDAARKGTPGKDSPNKTAGMPASAASKPQERPAAVRPPTWQEAVTFATELEKSARTIATNAANPGYKPATRAADRKTAAQTVATASPTVPSLSSSGTGRSGTAPTVPSSSRPSGIAAPATPRFTRLRTRIAQTLASYQRRPLNTAQHTPWEVMHGFIAFGIPTKLRVGGPGGDPVNAIGWVNTGGRCGGQVMLAAAGDRLTALRGIGVQGHSAQYLAILAQCRVAMNSPITIQSKAFTVADLVAEEKLACKSGTELTFALIALAHYLPTDSEWTARDGKTWSLEKLVAEEIEQPIRGAPCGGTHRLFGLSYGCQRRLRATGRLDGVYLRADKFVRDYQQFTLTKLQNHDGSFSTEWFKYPADRDDDLDRKIQTTGHILEWLVASLDQEDLFQPRITAAVEFLTTTLAREPSRDWKIGPLGHALHALTIYQERAWGTVLPGGIAAFHGPMKADPAKVPAVSQVAERPADGKEPARDAAEPVLR